MIKIYYISQLFVCTLFKVMPFISAKIAAKMKCSKWFTVCLLINAMNSCVESGKQNVNTPNSLLKHA